MKSVKEIKDLLDEKVEKRGAIHTLLTAEKRKMTEAEKTDFDTLSTEIAELRADLEIAKTFEADQNLINMRVLPVHGIVPAEQPKEVRNYDFFTAIAQKLDGKVEGIYAEMHQEAEHELRNLGTNSSINGIGIPKAIMDNVGFQQRSEHMATGGDATKGKNTIIPEFKGYFDVLYDETFLKRAGASYIDDCVGQVIFMKQNNKVTVTQVAENTAGSMSQFSYTQLAVDPKRYTANINMSKLLLLQSSVGVKNDALMHMKMQHQEQLEIDGLAAVVAAATQVLIAGSTNGATFTYDAVLELNRILKTNKLWSPSAAYLVNQNIEKKAKLTPELANTIALPVLKDGQMGGVNTVQSALIPGNLVKNASGAVCSEIFLGDFNFLKVCKWGGLDVTVDPYTKKKEGELEITADCFYNFGVTRAEAFLRSDRFLTA